MTRHSTQRYATVRRTNGRMGRRKRNRRIPTSRQAPRSAPRALGWTVPVLAAVVAMGGLFVGGRFGWEALVHSDRLRVTHIEVHGNHRTREAELLAYAGLKGGDEILNLNLDAMAAALRRHPWVRQAWVRRRLPDEVSINVVEQQPAIIVSLGDLYLANADGQVFKRLAAQDGVVLPVLTGLHDDAAHPLPASTTEHIRDALALMRAINGTSLGEPDELHWDDVLGWDVITRPGAHPSPPLRIHLGRDAVSHLGTAERVLARLHQLGRRAAVIWADCNETPNRVEVRLREGTQPSSSETLIARAK